ncbi:MAG: hypothetical protein A4E49_02286 [Methanosaeta sp. PtaU1.Bin112]|nr:MAG: hypothetical protein A4E49_02286 [Methanosaeta sp. PtaU1.Bin112]
MISSRLEKRSCCLEHEKERLWPVGFCLDEKTYPSG